MNKFMAGLTLGIIVTAGLFIFVNPLQKRAALPVYSDTFKVAIDSPPPVAPAGIAVTPSQSTQGVQGNDHVRRDSLVAFANRLLGVPYLYGSADPSKGFDCSGFITYVFNHFNMQVPRSSYEFGNMGIRRSVSTCRVGDLLLFTGTNPQERTIGHMGIVCDTSQPAPSFLHSSSGKAAGVTITRMDNPFYQERLMEVIDILSVQR